MAAERAIEQALPPGLITLEMAGVPVRLDFTELMKRFTDAVRPKPGEKLTRKERAISIGIKALAIMALEAIDDAAEAGKLGNFPRPHCPKGVDVTDYWLRYTASLAAWTYRDAVFPVEYGVTDDGGLVISGIGEPIDASEAAALASVAAADALPAPAGGSGAGAGAAGGSAPGTAEPAEPDNGGTHPGQSVGSVVHPGLAGVRQDGVRQAVSERVEAPVSDGASVRVG